MRRGWHELRQDATLTVARRLPVRWDVSAEAALPDMRRGRLARAVRQDLWRMLRRVRGFAPAVEVTREGGGLRVRAGGDVSGAVPPGTAERIEAMLADPARRTSWRRSAEGR